MTKIVKIASGIIGGTLTLGCVSIATVTKGLETPSLTSSGFVGVPLNFEKISGFNNDGYWKWNYFYLKETAERSKWSQDKLKGSWTGLKNWCSQTLLSEKNDVELEDIYKEFMLHEEASVCFASRNLVSESPWSDKNEEEIEKEVKKRLDAVDKKEE